MERADLNRRSLSDKEKENLRNTVRRVDQLEAEKRTAPASRAAVLRAEMRTLNQRCDAIIGAQ
jgi:hypothetical protein